MEVVVGQTPSSWCPSLTGRARPQDMQSLGFLWPIPLENPTGEGDSAPSQITWEHECACAGDGGHALTSSPLRLSQDLTFSLLETSENKCSWHQYLMWQALYAKKTSTEELSGGRETWRLINWKPLRPKPPQGLSSQEALTSYLEVNLFDSSVLLGWGVGTWAWPCRAAPHQNRHLSPASFSSIVTEVRRREEKQLCQGVPPVLLLPTSHSKH